MIFKSHLFTPSPGSRHRKKRLGRGESSGHGKTSTRGGKGQTARSGGKINRHFEGGQMPLYRRIPKIGFRNSAFNHKPKAVTISELINKAAKLGITEINVMDKRLGIKLKSFQSAIKVIGKVETESDLKGVRKIVSHAFSHSLRKNLENLGVVCETF
ncbi:MAG: 50S ribosomal protein L15 [Deltaproteobacteria bacterium]|nr:50S ribosomal protein L15 [Deltaproteobacteria bacterium]